jgi:PhnB protein
MATSSRIPEGYHTLTPHLIVRNAAQAIEFYKKAFGAEVRGQMPGPDGKTIMHAELQIGTSRLMLCDECPDWGVRSPLALGRQRGRGLRAGDQGRGDRDDAA